MGVDFDKHHRQTDNTVRAKVRVRVRVRAKAG